MPPKMTTGANIDQIASLQRGRDDALASAGAVTGMFFPRAYHTT